MFFIMAITDGRKDFEFSQTMTCLDCGRYGQYRVFMLYTVLSLFFIPAFKWNRRYYVQTSCCGVVYELDPEVGRRIACGEDVEIMPKHLSRTERAGWYPVYKRCANCGYETDEDFDYCPKCGTRF